MQLNKTSHAENRLHLVESLAKEVTGYYQGYWFLSSKPLLLTVQLTYVIEHGKIELMSN